MPRAAPNMTRPQRPCLCPPTHRSWRLADPSRERSRGGRELIRACRTKFTVEVAAPRKNILGSGLARLQIMSEISMTSQPDKPRVLLFSLRNIFGKGLFRCPHYEFEDIISEIDSVTLMAPEMDFRSRRATIAMRLPYHIPIRLNPGIGRIPVTTHYDVFFAV